MTEDKGTKRRKGNLWKRQNAVSFRTEAFSVIYSYSFQPVIWGLSGGDLLQARPLIARGFAVKFTSSSKTVLSNLYFHLKKKLHYTPFTVHYRTNMDSRDCQNRDALLCLQNSLIQLL